MDKCCCSSVVRGLLLPDPYKMFTEKDHAYCSGVLDPTVIDPTRPDKARVLEQFNILRGHILRVSHKGKAINAQVMCIESKIGEEPRSLHVRVSGAKRGVEAGAIGVYPILQALINQGIGSRGVRIVQVSLYNFEGWKPDTAVDLSAVVSKVLKEVEKAFGKMNSLTLFSSGAITLTSLETIPEVLVLDRALMSTDEVIRRVTPCCIGRCLSGIVKCSGWESNPREALIKLAGEKDLHATNLIRIGTTHDSYFPRQMTMEDAAIKALRQAGARVSEIDIDINPVEYHPRAHHGLDASFLWSDRQEGTQSFAMAPGESFTAAFVRQIMVQKDGESLGEGGASEAKDAEVLSDGIGVGIGLLRSQPKQDGEDHTSLIGDYFVVPPADE